jgi:predicted alpha/beta-fold hydrolase
MFVCDSAAAGTSSLRRALLLALFALSTLIVSAAENAPTPKADLTRADSDLPEFKFSYNNGLYATLVGFLSIKEVELKQQKNIKLKLDSFKKKVPVKAIIQSQPAPLVVVLLGVDGVADGKLGKLWPSWFAQAGYHVLTFDSTFLSSFIEISGHGVTGNLLAESERVRDIISGFLATGEMKNKVTRIGIVGMSYGGIQALVLGSMAAEGKLPFNVEAIQAYSPPIRMQKTGELIDKWYAEDRWQYTLVELAEKMSGHKPVSPDSAVPFDDSLMRAGIAAVFRLGLVDVIVRNDRVYKLQILPSGNNFDDEYVKRDNAATWGYTRFMNECSFPYWQRRMNYHQPSDLTDPIALQNLLPKQPAFSETIIAEDDPFNTPEDSAEVKSKFAGPRLTMLPHGGHLGFVNDPWTKAKLLTLFNKKETVKQAALEDRTTERVDTK